MCSSSTVAFYEAGRYYTGVAPWAFTGGTIQTVVVDVSGDHYVDLETEAMKAFKND